MRTIDDGIGLEEKFLSRATNPFLSANPKFVPLDSHRRASHVTSENVAENYESQGTTLIEWYWPIDEDLDQFASPEGPISF
jgi:hypothetical protein